MMEESGFAPWTVPLAATASMVGVEEEGIEEDEGG